MPRHRPYVPIAKKQLACLASAIAAGSSLGRTPHEAAAMPTAAPRSVLGRAPDIVLFEAGERAQSAMIPVGEHRERHIGPGQFVIIVLDHVLDRVRVAAGLGPAWVEHETAAIVADFGEAVGSIFVVPRADGAWLLRTLLVPVDASMRASVLVNAYRARPNRPPLRARTYDDGALRSVGRGIAVDATCKADAAVIPVAKRIEPPICETIWLERERKSSTQPLPSPARNADEQRTSTRADRPTRGADCPEDINRFGDARTGLGDLAAFGGRTALHGLLVRNAYGLATLDDHMPRGPQQSSSFQTSGYIDSSGANWGYVKGNPVLGDISANRCGLRVPKPANDHSVASPVPVGAAPNLLQCRGDDRDHSRAVGTRSADLDMFDTGLLHPGDRCRKNSFRKSGLAEDLCWLGILPPQPI